MNLMGLNGKVTEPENAKVSLLSAPYEKTCTYGYGASKGPEAIIRASEAAEFFDESLRVEIDKIPIATIPPPSIQDLEPEAMKESVFQMTRPWVQDGKIVAGLGGEHTVTLGFLQAVSERHPDLSVLQIDAHPDLRDSYEGRKICHATVGRRIMESHPLVQVGLRAFSIEEFELLEEESKNADSTLRPFSADWIHRHGDWVEKAVSCLNDKVYISLDLDGLDPSILPHTGTPEPGGLTWRQICDLLAKVGETRTIVGFDIVELAPDATSRLSDFTAAKLCLRMIGHSVFPGRKPEEPPF